MVASSLAAEAFDRHVFIYSTDKELLTETATATARLEVEAFMRTFGYPIPRRKLSDLRLGAPEITEH